MIEPIVTVARRYVEHSMTVFAAAVSFWAMVSLVPLIAMLVFAVAIFVEPDAVAAFVEEPADDLAGAGALLVRGLIDRQTRDLDYFTVPGEEEALSALRDALERAGWEPPDRGLDRW